MVTEVSIAADEGSKGNDLGEAAARADVRCSLDAELSRSPALPAGVVTCRMPRTRLSIASLGCLIAVGAAACSRPPAYAHLDGPPCSQVPLRVEKGLMLIDVTVAGSNLPLIVDTGSVQSITLLPEDLERLRLPLNGQSRTIHDAKGNSLKVRGFTVPELRIGQVVLREVSGWEARRSPGWEPPVKAGHIGRGLLSAFRLTVDVPAQTMHLDQATCPRPSALTRVAAQLGSDGMTSQATADGAALTLIWDTAATYSILKPEKAISMSTYLRDGQRFAAPRSLVIGGAPLEVDFAVVPLDGIPADGLVGSNVFRDRAVTFDFAGSALFLAAPPATR